MHAMDFYVSTCRCVMQADPDVPESWAELQRLLPCLRQSLSCYVCFQLLSEPMGPDHNVCKHSVCEKCIGGKMKLKPSCSWCKDHWDFVPNTLLKVLVSCFKKLCIYIYNSQIGRNICNSSLNGETNNLMVILKEVVDFDDSYTPGYVPQTFICPDEPSPNSADLHCDSLIQPEHSLDVKPGCSSDDDTLALHTFSSEEETLEELDTIDKEQPVNVIQRRQHLSRSSNRTNRTSETTLTKRTMPKRKLLDKKVHRKAAVNTVSMKKTTLNNRKTYLRKRVVKKSYKRQPLPKSRLHAPRRQKISDAPRQLDKIDNSEPLIKKVKKELQPPELKPPSFCKCGKSGNFNQLTCLGQRCPCYSMKLPCIGCKCKGCRNPKKGPNIQLNKINYMSDLWSTCSRTSSAIS